MKKLLVFLFFIIFLWGCKQQQEEASFPIDMVIENSRVKLDKLQIDSKFELTELEQIDTSFLAKWLKGLNIPELGNRKFENDFLSKWYFGDYRKINQEIIFSILQNDGTGFWAVYYLNYDTISKTITNFNFLTQFGGDGSYLSEGYIKWNDENQIEISLLEYEEMELNDSADIVKHDSTVFAVNFMKKPLKPRKIFYHSVVDTLRSNSN